MEDQGFSGSDSEVSKLFSQNESKLRQDHVSEDSEDLIFQREPLMQTNNSHENIGLRNQQSLTTPTPLSSQSSNSTDSSQVQLPDESEIITIEIPIALCERPVLKNALIASYRKALHFIKRDKGDSTHRNSGLRGIMRAIIGVKGVYHFYFQKQMVRNKGFKLGLQYERALNKFITENFPLEDEDFDLFTLFQEHPLRVYSIFLSLNQSTLVTGQERVVLNKFKAQKFYQNVGKLEWFLSTPVARVLKIRDIFMRTLHFALRMAKSDDLRQYLNRVIKRFQR